jgi:HEAT repeat protein
MRAQAQGHAILRMAQANHDVDKAKSYAVVLGKLHVVEAQDYLLQLARDTAPSPTLSASYLALGRIGSVRAVPVLARAMGQDFDKGRENAAQALVSIHSTQALPAMFAYLEHERRDIRFAAASVIAQIPDVASGPKLLKALQKPGSVAVGPAAYALGQLKVREASAPLASLLADRASPERETMAQALGWLGAREHIPLLLTTLRESDGDARYGAAWSLGVLQAEEAVEELQRAASGSNLKLANHAIEALGMIHSEKSLAFLVQKAKASPELANGVMAAIAGIPGRAAAQALEKFAAHDDLRISRPALQALAQRKDASTVAALMQLMDSVVPDNRKQVYLALGAVTGQKLASAQEWRNWYAQQGKAVQ